MLTGSAAVWGLVRLALVLAGAAVFTCGIVVFGMAMALLRPPRMSDGRAMYHLRRLSPGDLGLAYELMNFRVGDQKSGHRLKIAGWWIPNPKPSNRSVLILHGYADAKVGGIAWAPLLRSLGFNVLAIDLRAHGESEGRFTTAGYYERYDVSQIIDELKIRQPEQTARMALFGVSLGAAVAAATAVMRDDLCAVILECPYTDFPTAVLSHADRLPVPGRFFQRLSLRLCQVMAKVDYNQVRPVELIGKIRCPVWVVQSGDDPFLSTEDQERIAAAVAARTDGSGIWRIADSFHVLALADQPVEYRRRLAEFLEKACPT